MKTKDDFKLWLKRLPPDTTFCQDLRILSCPIARFTGEPALKQLAQGWQFEFMDKFDRLCSSSLEDAIRIAETL